MAFKQAGRLAKSILGKGIRKAPLGALEQVVRRDVVVYLYHVIEDEPLPHIRALYPYKTPEEFESDVLCVL